MQQLKALDVRRDVDWTLAVVVRQMRQAAVLEQAFQNVDVSHFSSVVRGGVAFQQIGFVGVG